MLRRDLARYHDIATNTKRGATGLGSPVSVSSSASCVTRGDHREPARRDARRDPMASRVAHRAPWKWIAAGLVDSRGTAVRMALSNQLSPLLDGGCLEEIVRRHFEPLLDSSFTLTSLAGTIQQASTVEVDGRELAIVAMRRSVNRCRSSIRSVDAGRRLPLVSSSGTGVADDREASPSVRLWQQSSNAVGTAWTDAARSRSHHGID